MPASCRSEPCRPDRRRAVGAAEQHRVDEQREELPERHPALVAVGERVRLPRRRRACAAMGVPNSRSIARSTSRWPPYAAGSIRYGRPSAPASTLPRQRSPCSRAGGSGGPASAGSRSITASIAPAPPAGSAPRSDGRAQQRRQPVLGVERRPVGRGGGREHDRAEPQAAVRRARRRRAERAARRRRGRARDRGRAPPRRARRARPRRSTRARGTRARDPAHRRRPAPRARAARPRPRRASAGPPPRSRTRPAPPRRATSRTRACHPRARSARHR